MAENAQAASTGPSASNPYNGPAGTTGMAQAFLNYQQSQGQQNQAPYGSLAARNPQDWGYDPVKGSYQLSEGTEYTGAGGGIGSGGGLWSGGGSQGALTLSNDLRRQAQTNNAGILDAQRRTAANQATASWIALGQQKQQREAYQNAMNSSINYLNAGQSEANNYFGLGLENSQKNLDLTLEALQSGQAQGRDDITAGFNEAKDTLTSGREQGRADIETNFKGAIDRYDVLSQLAPEAIGEYGNRVLSDFDSSFAQYQKSPVYQFALGEGMKGIQRAAGAKGNANSGATIKAMQRYASDYASQNYMNYTNTRIGQSKDLANFAASGVVAQADLQSRMGEGMANIGGIYDAALANNSQNRGTALSDQGQFYDQQRGLAYGRDTSANTTIRTAQGNLAGRLASERAQFAYNGTLGSSGGGGQRIGAGVGASSYV